MEGEQQLDLVKRIFGEYFKEKELFVLPAYRGYLAAGRTRKYRHPLVMWLHKANVEGLTKIMLTTAVERSFDALASLIPLGTLGYTFLKDVLHVKMPRDVYTFVPDTHYVEMGSLTISADGQILEGPIGGMISLTKKTVTAMGKTFTSGVKGLLSFTGVTKSGSRKGKQKPNSGELLQELSVVIMRFPPKFLKHYLSTASESLSETAKSFLHSVPVPEFKITDVDLAKQFLKYLQQLGFSVEQSALFKPLNLPNFFGTKEEMKRK